jgi:hypothetical protein
MPIEISRTLILKDKAGNVIPVEKDSSIAQTTDLKASCDGPRCESRNGQIVSVAWNQEAAAADPNAVPDAFFRILQIVPNPKDPTKAFLFCSRQCAKDYLEYVYVPPLSPREQAEIQQNNAAVDAKKGAAVVQFPKKSEEEVAK